MDVVPYTPAATGLYRMPAKDYHAAPGVGKHSLDAIADCPKMLEVIRKYGIEATECMEFGTLCHTAVLEPDLFPTSYHLRPETYVSVNKKTGAHEVKEWSGNSTSCKAWLAAHTDKPVLKAEDLTRLKNIAKSVEEHPIAGPMFDQSNGIAELSMFARCPETGLTRKGRADWLTCDAVGTWVMPDLKFVTDASERGFRKQFEDLRYFVQAAYYIDLMELINGVKCRFLFVAVETQPMHPKSDIHRVQVFDVFEPHLDTGRNTYMRDLRRYKQCLDSGEWPSDTDKIKTLALSSWYLRQNAI